MVSPKTATVLPFKRNTISPATQQVIEALEAEIANLRSGKAKADAMILILAEGDASDLVFVNLSHVEAIGTLTATTIELSTGG